MLFTQIFLYITFRTNRYVKHRILHVMWEADAISRVKNANWMRIYYLLTSLKHSIFKTECAKSPYFAR